MDLDTSFDVIKPCGKKKKPDKCKFLILLTFIRFFTTGGEGGIRTHGDVATTPDFESGTFGHSATSPKLLSLVMAILTERNFCAPKATLQIFARFFRFC